MHFQGVLYLVYVFLWGFRNVDPSCIIFDIPVSGWPVFSSST